MSKDQEFIVTGVSEVLYLLGNGIELKAKGVRMSGDKIDWNRSIYDVDFYWYDRGEIDAHVGVQSGDNIAHI